MPQPKRNPLLILGATPEAEGRGASVQSTDSKTHTDWGLFQNPAWRLDVSWLIVGVHDVYITAPILPQQIVQRIAHRNLRRHC